MNGIVDINLNEKKVTLRFNYHACMEFESRLFKNATDNNAKVLTDLIYSGLFGEAVRNEKPVPAYSDSVDLLDELANLENYAEQTEKIWNVYNESKFGKDFQERLKEFAKKKVEESEPPKE